MAKMVSHTHCLISGSSKGSESTGNRWRISCTWGSSQPQLAQDNYPFTTIDLKLKKQEIETEAESEAPCSQTTTEDETCRKGTRLHDIVEGSGVLSTQNQDEVIVKVIVPTCDGFLSRRDILELRLSTIPNVRSTIRYTTPTHHFEPTTNGSPRNKGWSLAEWLQLSALALVLEDGSVSGRVESELRARLSFSWMRPNRAAHSTIAVVNGGYEFDLREKTFTHRGTFDAAKALDMSLIILDRPGHWLQEAPLSPDWDYTFIAIDMTADENLHWRIYQAVKEAKLDGVVTFTQDFLIATARAAEMLGLRTEPVPAFEIAHNKYETRRALGTDPIRLDGSAQLREQGMLDKLEKEVSYPLIVKPCEGCGSRGVSKAIDANDLVNAVEEIEKHCDHGGILIEPYVKGPEVDANFVLWEGEMLFCEITDETPCRGDASDAGASEPFIETNMVYPSGLPLSEQQMIKEELYHHVIKLGFRSGVFHVEARVRNSAVTYQDVGNGVVDLVADGPDDRQTRETEVYLLEVNARPPGQDAVYANLFAHGVDYFGLHLLNAIGDEPRFRALSTPFSPEAQQLWTAMALVPMLPYKVYVPPDFSSRVLAGLRDARARVIWPECFRPDEVVSSEDGTGIVGTYILSSSHGRRQVMEGAQEVETVARDILLSLEKLSG